MPAATRRPAAAGLLAALALTGCSPATATSSASTAMPDSPARQLAELRIAGRGSMAGYSDKQFPHWTSQGHQCDTREVVLKRDGRDVTVDAKCHPASGTWTSPYDGQTWTRATDVDIDHLVPRGQAWVSGAVAWTLAQRTAFANDLDRPELITVTDKVNQQKKDMAPDEWKPPLVSYWCTYATDWIAVKYHYVLTITTAEKTALESMLRTCPAVPTARQQ